MTAFLEGLAEGFHRAATTSAAQIQQAIANAKPPAPGPGLLQALHQLGATQPALSGQALARYADGVAEQAVTDAAAATFTPGGAG